MTTTRRIVDVLWIAGLVGYAMVCISFNWKNPWLLSLLLVPAPVAIFWRWGAGMQALILALSGVIVGPITEVFAVAGGLWTYHETGGLPLVPPWIFVIWACFAPTMWLVARSLFGLCPGREVRSLDLPLLIGLLATEIVVFVTLGHSSLLAILGVLPLAVILIAAFRRWELLAFFIAGGIVGPLCESLPIAAGAWHYPNPEILGMPAWLPVGYSIFGAIVALIAGTCATWLQNRQRNRLPSTGLSGFERV